MITARTLTAVATVVIGGFNMVYGGRLVWRSWRARRWPTLEGQLISADLTPRKRLMAQAIWGRFMRGPIASLKSVGLQMRLSFGPSH